MAKQRITTTAKRMQALINRVAASAASPIAGGLAEHIEKTAAEGHDGVGLHDHQSTEQGGLLDHGWLSGLGDDDHPQYASANGAGIRAAYAAERLNKSVLPGFGLSGGGVLTENRTLAVDAVDDPGTEARVLKSSAAGKLTLRGLTLRGDLLPSAPDTINIGSSSSPFLTGHISEMYGTRFIEETISVAGGHWIIPKSSATLAVEMDAVTTSLITIDDVGSDKVDAQGNVSRTGWSTGDYLVFRDIDKYERMRIISGSGTTWTVARDVDGSGANTWGAGSTVANLGKSGDGWLSFQGGRDYGLSIWERYGTNPGDVTNFLRAGNLRNWNGYPSADLPGFGLGDSERFISFDRVHGLRIHSPVIIGGNLGFATDALLYCAFDGPKPYEREYGGSYVGHTGQMPSTASGGLIFRPGRFGKAIQIAEATTNLLSYTSFETGSVLTGWTAVSGSFPHAAVFDTGRAMFGKQSARIRFNPDTVNRGMIQSFTAPADGAYTFSGYIWITDYTEGQLVMDLGSGSPRARFEGVTDGWVRFSVTHTLTAGTRQARIFTDSTPKFAGRFLLDGLQVEQKAYPTPYCDGSLGTGHAWTGAAFGSPSTRQAASLAYPNVFDKRRGTISLWFYRGFEYSGSAEQGLFDASVTWNSNDQFGAWVRTTGKNLAFSISGKSSTGPVVPLGQWSHAAFVWDRDAGYFQCYLNGEPGSVGVYDTSPTLLPEIHLGILRSLNNRYLNDCMDDFMITDRALSESEIRAIYESGAPMNIRKGPFDLYLGGGTSGGWIVGNGDGLAGYSADGTRQAWFGSDGRFYAEGGAFTLDHNGMQLYENGDLILFNYYPMPNEYPNWVGIKGSLLYWPDWRDTWLLFETFDTDGGLISRFKMGDESTHWSRGFLEFYAKDWGSGYDNTVRVDPFGLRITGWFACNGKNPQPPPDIGGAVNASAVDATYGTQERDVIIDLRNKVNALRTALINNGILSN